jgi:hypothetical protein
MSRPTKREWIAAYLADLEKTGYSGRVQITLEFNKGGITKLVPLKQENYPHD